MMLQGEISGFREDLFSPRKSALNLLGVISISKVSITYNDFTTDNTYEFLVNIALCLQGPPVAASVLSKRKKGEKNRQKNRSSMGELLVIPFLSKFPIPTDITTSVTKIVNE